MCGVTPIFYVHEHGKKYVAGLKLTASDVPQKLRSEGLGTRVGPFDVDKDATFVSVGLPEDEDSDDNVAGA